MAKERNMPKDKHNQANDQNTVDHSLDPFYKPFSSSDEDSQSFKNFLFSEFITPNLTATPLISNEERTEHLKINLDRLLEATKNELHQTKDLFIAKALSEEKPLIEEFLNHFVKNLIGHMGSQRKIEQKPSNAQLDLLIDIARRELKAKKYLDAARLFSLLIHLDASDGEIWVGWAISAQGAGGTTEEVQAIYSMATSLLPHDYYVCLYAAEYSMSKDKHEEVKSLVQRCLDELNAANLQDSITYKKFDQLMNKLNSK